MASHRRRALAAVLALAFCISCLHPKPARVAEFREVMTLLTVADLIQNPTPYHRQMVMVEGWYRTGDRVAVLQPTPQFRGGSTIWVYDDNREDEPAGPPPRDRKRQKERLSGREIATQAALDRLWGQTAHVVLQGEFRCGTGYGHLGRYPCALFLDRVLAVGD